MAWAVAWAILAVGWGLAPSAAAAAAPAAEAVLWPEHQRAFFQDGPGLLLDGLARAEFAALDSAGRDRAMATFLVDPIPETPENELTVGIELRRRLVATELATPLDDRAKLLFLHGTPVGRQVIDCGSVLVPIELWSYGEGHTELLLFSERGSPRYKLWQPSDGKRVLYSPLMKGWFQELQDFGQAATRLDIKNCAAVARVDAVTETEGLFRVIQTSDLGARIGEYLEPPADLAAWSRAAAATVVPEPPKTLGLETVDVSFPFRSGLRIATRFTAEIDGALLAVEDLEEKEPEVRIEVIGLLEQNGDLFEEFKVRFEREPPADGEPVTIVFERRLRPGRQFVARLKIRDAVGGAESDLVTTIAVPREVERVVAGAGGVPAETVAGGLLEGVDSLSLVRPVTDGLSKAWRAEAMVTGDRIRRVIFFVDGEQQLIRTRPPFTADLRLEDVPTEQVVSAQGFDGDGELVSEDKVLLNRSRGAFAVRILSPDKDVAAGPALARAEVSVPEGGRIEAVEFLLDERPVASLATPPWETEIEIVATSGVSYLTAVAHLADGRRAEDILFLNTPDNFEQVEIGLVELFATVSDGSGKLVVDLESADFQVMEGGVEREIQRFERVDSLPLVVGFAIDASGSMADHMSTAREAAVGFLQSVLRVEDRAFAVAFNDAPRLVAAPTDDPGVVERALTEVHSEGWTTLYDAVVKSLFYFKGFGGRRALVLLSDGEDTASKTSFEEALRYARESGAVIYSIGLGSGAGLGLRNKLKRLSDETGGRYFHAGKATELSAVYAEIERELRSQYFLTFTPTEVSETALSEIEVKIRDRRLKVRATRGYAP